MSSTPTLSALDPDRETYPHLSDDQIGRLQRYGHIQQVRAGDILYQPGDLGVPLFVLLSATVEIVQPDATGERPVTVLCPRMFTGEAGMIGGQRALVLARVLHDGEVLKLQPQALRSLVTADAQLCDIFLRAFILRRLMLVTRQLGNVLVIGSHSSANTVRLREFLGRNEHPYTYVDLDTDKASRGLLNKLSIAPTDVPIVICNGKSVLRNPSSLEVANCLGLNDDVRSSLLRDLIIVGAGPAGLAAAVYAASEGLEPLVIESHAPGGQAGSSSRIENYLGFPTGVTGQELASNAATQAKKFGAKMVLAQPIVELRCRKRPYELLLQDGNVLFTRTVVIATGARYKKPNVPELQRFEGRGVHYGATYIEAQSCIDEHVVVIGGGNSAGQAAVFLAQMARRVFMLIRAGDLSQTMSRYLIQRIVDNPKIHLIRNTELTGLSGEETLDQVTWKNKITGETTHQKVHQVFVMAGAAPNTDWLRGCVALDERGFILTGRDLPLLAHRSVSPPWPLKRPPQIFESSLPGVFAIGDVRAGSVKRVASSVGEGAVAISLVHRSLSDL